MSKIILQLPLTASSIIDPVNAIYEQFNARRKAFAAAEADREEQLEFSAATDEDLAALQSSAERREKI